MVALRKESVDRNCLAARPRAADWVALRKESVDRNVRLPGAPSLWPGVALRKESVDRNLVIRGVLTCAARRSPQGERG